MLKKGCPYCLLIMLSATTLVYANTSSCPSTSKTTCKSTIILNKLKSFSLPQNKDKQVSPAKSSTTTTFDIYIVPFLKAVAPHFYDQVIKGSRAPVERSLQET